MQEITTSDLREQENELGQQTIGSFIKETRGSLTFFDGFRWNDIRSKTHLAQLESALEIYLDKKLEHIEYTLALTMSKRRGEVFEVYQKAVMDISERIRSQTIDYREKSKEKVMSTLKRFMEDADAFDKEIKSSPISSSRAEKLLEANESLTNQNFENVFSELKVELDHYNEMCERIYVGMSDEIERHRRIT